MFKKVILIIFAGIILLISSSYFFFTKKGEYQPEEQNANEQSIRIGRVDLLVDIADEPSEQTQGLSGRDKMAENKGMLFIFPQPFISAFWMKDMLFSLDMLWIDANGVIIAITKDISPDTYPQTFSPPSPVKYVLEVNSGWSDKNKIKVGDKITLK